MSEIIVDTAAGVAWEADPRPMLYGADYWNKYAVYDETALGDELTRLRLLLVSRHLPPGSELIDVGIGAGKFVREAEALDYIARGYDVNPHTVRWLATRDLFACPYQPRPSVAAITLWDALEHLPCPQRLLSAVRPGGLVFLALPICPDLLALEDWKHYRPNEHHWYWTAAGFERWAREGGFEILESNDAETRAGRKDIRSYALRKASPSRDFQDLELRQLYAR